MGNKSNQFHFVNPDEQSRLDRCCLELVDYLIVFGKLSEVTDDYLAQRKLPWKKMHDSPVNSNDVLRCDVSPNRATISVAKPELWWRWQACIERPKRFKDSKLFEELDEAIDWAESELLSLQAKAESDDDETPTVEELKWKTMSFQERMNEYLTPTVKERLKPYWIVPSAIDSPRITYKVYIALAYKPTKTKRLELSFGESVSVASEYPSPESLAHELHLDLSKFDVEDGCGFYFIESRTVYFQSEIASAQALKVWDESKIVEVCGKRKIISTRYGYKEELTGFITYLGGYDDPDSDRIPFSDQGSRDDYLQRQALWEALTCALDIDTLRKMFFGGTRMSDDELLRYLHSDRAKSRFATEEMRSESREWLRIKDEQKYSQK